MQISNPRGLVPKSINSWGPSGRAGQVQWARVRQLLRPRILPGVWVGLWPQCLVKIGEVKPIMERRPVGHEGDLGLGIHESEEIMYLILSRRPYSILRILLSSSYQGSIWVLQAKVEQAV